MMFSELLQGVNQFVPLTTEKSRSRSGIARQMMLPWVESSKRTAEALMQTVDE